MGEATGTARSIPPGRSRVFGYAEVFACIALLSFLAARFLPVLEVGYACPARTLLHVPCPTCGMTRAFVALAHGRVSAAFLVSPAGALLAGGAWLLAVADAARLALGLTLPALSPRAARAAVAAGAAVLLASWAWVIVHEVVR